MSKHNQIYIEGRLGRAPSYRATPGGNNLCTFTLAVFQGEKNPTMWLLVKTIKEPPNINRGDKVSVRGRLSYEEWKADGQEKSCWGVWADDIEILKPKATTTEEEAPF